MRPGDTVTIYQDPVTQEYGEGEAKLISLYREDTGDGLEMWWVKFLGDDCRTIRTIYTK